MNDEELIRWLRNLEPMDYELRHGTFQAAAANRIETLIAERDEQIEWVKRLADDLIVAESKLSKALSMQRRNIRWWESKRNGFPCPRSTSRD